jgi:putative transposase
MGKLVRYQQCGCFHFVTFSCYRRRPLLDSKAAYSIFEREFEAVRVRYQLVVTGYVLMPEHVHLLVGEPVRSSLSVALQVLKQQTSHKLKPQAETQFWQRRYYDFNVWSEEKRIEKLTYMHRNPRGPQRTIAMRWGGSRSRGDWWRNPRIGHGPATAITQAERKGPWKSNPDGRRFDGEINCRNICVTRRRRVEVRASHPSARDAEGWGTLCCGR